MSLGKKMFSGVVWSGIEKLSVQVVSFVLGIILARLLTPDEYGTIGLLIVFTSISQVFIDGGFGKALIQRQDRTDRDISTVFYFNMGISIACYGILWLTAPLVAQFYGIEDLTSLLRVLAISLIFHGMFAIPYTLLTINMNFKSLTKVTLTATLISGVIAVYLAYDGYGEWALVWQTLVRTFIMVVLVWPIVKWRPLFQFSKDSFNKLFPFGSKLLIGSLLDSLINNFSALFIAKVISTKQLGYYTRGTQFADTLFSTINTVLNNVLLPGLAPIQDQKEVLVASTKKIIKTSAIFIMPLFMGLAAMADPIIRVLLTDKWAMAIPIMQIICLARMITIISGINVNILYVIGRSDWALKQQYLKITIRVVLLLIAIPFGIIPIALAELAATIVHFFINSYYPGKYMDYGALKQINDLKGIFFMALIVALAMFSLNFLINNDWLKILISLFCALPVYYSLLRLNNVNELKDIMNRIKK